MCGGGKPKVDNSAAEAARREAAEARRREEERKARIKAGTERIDETFGTFTDSYYDGIRDDYVDYYQPQLDRQLEDAREGLTFALARSGTLDSSIAAEKQADLTTHYNDNLASILSKAQNSAETQRRRVQGEKSSLVSLLNQTADADRVANEALARTKVLFNERPAYNPLGDLFGGLAAGVGNYLQHQRDRQLYDAYFGHTPGAAKGNKSSARIVGG